MDTELTFDDPESLRSRLEQLGYEIASEREIQSGYQFRCKTGAIATWYKTGSTLAQGKDAPILERLLAEESGEPTLYMKNRVLVVHGDLEEECEQLSEHLAQFFGIEPVLVEADSFVDGRIERIQRQHQRFTQFAIIVARRDELMEEESFENSLHDLPMMLGRNRLVIVSDEPVKAKDLGLPFTTPMLPLSVLEIEDAVNAIVEQMMRTVDRELRSLMQQHFDARKSSRWDIRSGRAARDESLESIPEAGEEDDPSLPWQE